MKLETCYMCEDVATSREHAPPQCLFPTIDVVGRDLRRNLITVASCDEHNGKKSHDDEYLQAVILMFSVLHSDVAKHAFLGNYLRAVRRAPHRYSQFFRDQGNIDENRLRVLQFDRPRFNRSIDRLARALYFAETGERWNKRIVTGSPSIFVRDESGNVIQHPPTIEAVQITRQFLGGSSNRGENPDVFMYRMRFDGDEGVLGFAARFYDAFDMYAFSSTSIPDIDDEE